MSHLEQKALLTQQLGDLSAKEKELQKKLTILKQHVEEGNINRTTGEDTSALVTEEEILSIDLNTLQNEVSNIEKTIINLEAEKKDIEDNISLLQHQEADYALTIEKSKKNQSTKKKASMKVKSQIQRLSRFKSRHEEQINRKENLQSFLLCLDTIEQVVTNHSPLSHDNSQKAKNFPIEITPEVTELIIEANRTFHGAQIKFKPNSLIPFLLDADKAYQASVEALIRLSAVLPDSLLEEEFSNQVLTIATAGLNLNTRHLNAVGTMIEKLESGSEIAPLASFANEIKEYFVKNLQLLRISRAIFSPD